MSPYPGSDDTIAAIITPAGTGGVGIVRLSGVGAFDAAGKIFQGRNSGSPSEWKGFSVHHGWVRDADGAIIDEALVTVMRAPKSYTCEDVAEISCHGGSAAVRAVLERCLENGARLARPGEFTKRAFLNGRIDLAQAEAVLDIISARTDAALRACERQLKGELSRELGALREELMTALAGIEALLNFPEDDTDAGQSQRIGTAVAGVRGRIGALLATARSGRILREGIRVVICGKPNVGKSSLLNALLRAPRAIVTDVAGTTRDIIEESANFDGIPVNLIDTAGILAPRDKVEEEAVRRSRASIEGADVVMAVLDTSRPLEEADRALLAGMRHPHVLIVGNKSDLPPAPLPDLGRTVLKVSAQSGAGLEELKALIVKTVLGGQGFDGRGLIINDLRHAEALRGAEAALGCAAATISTDDALEIAAEDIKAAVRALDVITGRQVDEDVIESIFSRFCIGK